MYGVSNLSLAQHKHVELHTSDKWSECSFEIDPSLTQEAWKEFAQEAGLVVYFRPLKDARPMGAGHFEVALLQWQTKFDDTKAAWNDTFVHPDSTHWLKDGDRLPIPGITARVGITKRLDAGIYFTKNPGANYGFYGGQLQYNLVNEEEKNWSASGRMSFISLYGPEDLKLRVYGIDVVVSKEFPIYSTWASVSPYIGISSYLLSAREITEKVDLQNELTADGQGMVGAVIRLASARIGVEYNLARINTISFKLGVAF